MSNKYVSGFEFKNGTEPKFFMISPYKIKL